MANAYTMHSPYWFGLAELILARRVESILVSRWKLDELSARIYVDFFDRASAGVPMDQALNLARRDFQDSTLTRGKNRVTGEHPFFWAGITYIGRPGSTLYDAGESDRGTALVVLIIVLLIVAYSLVRLIISSRRRRH